MPSYQSRKGTVWQCYMVLNVTPENYILERVRYDHITHHVIKRLVQKLFCLLQGG